VKFSGTEEQMLRAGAFIEAAAQEVGATWNADERLTASTTCTFIGGDWDHSGKTIACTEKFLRRLPQKCPQTLSLQEAERLFGRLIHAAGMLRLPLAHYYWAMKWYRRRVNGFTNGTVGIEEQHIVPWSVRTCLQQWIGDARRIVKIPHGGFGDKVATLFTDASLKGWGAILVTAAAEVRVAGAAWKSTYDSSYISTLEASAVVNALVPCGEWIRRDVAVGRLDALTMVMDNTSVIAAAARGTAREDTLNAEIARMVDILRALEIGVVFQYITSAANPADGISRGRQVPWANIASGLETCEGGLLGKSISALSLVRISVSRLLGSAACDGSSAVVLADGCTYCTGLGGFPGAATHC
jgi:hypothetical protein